jgi:hypothetical protein
MGETKLAQLPPEAAQLDAMSRKVRDINPRYQRLFNARLINALRDPAVRDVLSTMLDSDLDRTERRD